MEEQLNMFVEDPVVICTHSARMTFEDMAMGESRYFDITHLQLFRVFAGRLNKDPDRDFHCVIEHSDHAVCVSKLKPSFDIGETE